MYIDTKQLGEIKPCLYYSQVYDNNFYMNMHQHKTLEIMYVSNGSMCITTVNSNNTEQDITVFQGEFVIIKENLLHKLSIPRNAVILNVEFESFSTNKSIDELFFYNSIASAHVKARDTLINQPGIIIMEDTHKVLQSLTRLHEELSQNTPEDFFELSYTLLLSQLISDILNCNNVNATQKRGNIFIKKALDYINSNIHKDISLEEICKHTACSKAYLEKLFKAEFNCTISKKINQLRIARAKTLLKSSSASSIDVGAAVGFNNKQSFINNFKEVTGRTPIEYKKQHRVEYKILRAYEKSYFDKKFDKLFRYSVGSFICGKEWKQALTNKDTNTILYSGDLNDLFNKDKNEILHSSKFVFIDSASLFANDYSLLSFSENIIQSGLFDNFIGFYINYNDNYNDQSQNLIEFINSIHEFYPLKRIILDCEKYGITSSKPFENTHVTDLILPKENNVLQHFITSKLNLWLKKDIYDLDQINNSHSLSIKNFGGIVYSLVEKPTNLAE